MDPKDRFNPKLFEFDPKLQYKWQVFDTVTVATITFNRLEYTKKLLDSLFRYTHLPYQLLIVDNGSDDGSREYLRELSSQKNHITVIQNQKNIGMLRGLMQIRDRVSEGLLVYFDNDIELLSNYWLVHIQKAYHAARLEFGHSNCAFGIRLTNAEEYGFRYSTQKKILRIPTEQNSLPRTSFAATSKDGLADQCLDEEIVLGSSPFLMSGAITCPVKNFKSIKFEGSYPKYLGGEDTIISEDLVSAGVVLGYLENGPIARHNDWPYTADKIKMYERLTRERAVTDWGYVKWKLSAIVKKFKK